MCENLMSEVMWHQNCRRKLPDLMYPPCEFNEYGSNDNSNINWNNNNNNNNNNNDLEICGLASGGK